MDSNTRKTKLLLSPQLPRLSPRLLVFEISVAVFTVLAVAAHLYLNFRGF
jgi:hypothetical protein